MTFINPKMFQLNKVIDNIIYVSTEEMFFIFFRKLIFSKIEQFIFAHKCAVWLEV